MCRDLLRNLETAAILEVRGNPRRPESVVSDLRMDAGSLCPPADHPVGIGLTHRPACERIRFPDRRAELRSLGIHFEARALDVGFQGLYAQTLENSVRQFAITFLGLIGSNP
jgi:hypothetical protein